MTDCTYCGAPVPPSNGRKPRRYCSRLCVWRASRERRTGVPFGTASRSLAERLWAGVEKLPNGCWEWRSTRWRNGYGLIARGDSQGQIGTHRAAWEITNGPIPDGMFVCHRCDNPPCCNPGHPLSWHARREQRRHEGQGSRAQRSPLGRRGHLPTAAAGGRMSETWIEWGVRRTWGPDVGSVAFFERDYRTARKCAKDWPGVLVHRTVTAADWADGEPTKETR